MRPSRLASALRDVGQRAGLDTVGFTTADAFGSTRLDLEERKRRGLHAGMQFTYRNPARSTEPRRALETARSIVVGAHFYAGSSAPPPTGAVGRVARYAQADHYAVLRRGLSAVGELLEAHGWRARVVADDNALVDRAAAVRAGIGWYGKNANVLVPGRGSWCVLGSVLTDAELPPSERLSTDCGTCVACISGCPTGAIIAPGVIDAGRCLAWLVQAPGEIPEPFRAAMGSRLYGCDDCQEVCPANRRDERPSEPPDADPDGSIASVKLSELLRLDDETLLATYGRWYIPRREPRHLRRNALVIVGNTPDLSAEQLTALLGPYLHSADPLLRAHAVWAARRHGREDLLVDLADERDPAVLAELDRPAVVPVR